MTWQPSATLKHLQQRANILAAIRRFFSARQVMEVEVPLLAATTVTDPHLDSLCVADMGRGGAPAFLQTSPEYAMKRLLAAGSGAIYSLSKAFRKDEVGKHHNPEFTMLEWYRPGLDDRALAEEVVALIQSLQPEVVVEYCSYAERFEQACGLNPHQAHTDELRQLAQEKLGVNWPDESRNLWLDLLFTHLVEPTLGDGVCVVFDYPASQSALAKIAQNKQGESVARRFEVYWRGIELANGYWELTDAAEQKTRFEADVALRKSLGKPVISPDTQLLAALEAGMPECAGVALGVDRLLMCLTQSETIGQVMSFVWAEGAP